LSNIQELNQDNKEQNYTNVKEDIIQNNNNNHLERNPISPQTKNSLYVLGNSFISTNEVKNNTIDNKKDKRYNKSFDIKKEAVKKIINLYNYRRISTFFMKKRK
jgi:hypothetical protein